MHAPYGELNEKFRGASSSNDSPSNVHAELLTEGLHLLAVVVGLHRDRGDPFGELERGLDRIGDPATHVGLGDESVDHHLDRVLVSLGEADGLGQIADLTIDAGTREPLAPELGEQLAVLPLPPAHDGGEHLEPGPLRQLEHLVDDLLRRLPADRSATVGAMWMSHPRVEDAQVVVHLRDGADRRPRVPRRGLLIDRDRG